MAQKKLVIVGGGFAGMNVARKLNRANLDITLIDRKNHHLFQPLLYQAATATLSPSDISVALREIFARQRNTTVIMGEVVTIDKTNKVVILGNGDQFSYDYLVLAVGSHHSYFGHSEWEKYAPGIKTLKDALTIREHILLSFEKAERLDSTSEMYKYLTFIIVGGGPTGVEFAGSIAELKNKTLKRNFRNLHTEKVRIFLIEGSDNLLNAFPHSLSARTKKDLEKMGVTVLTNRIVTEINEDGVQVGDTFIESKNVIWAAGNTIPKIMNTLGAEQDRQGRIVVKKDLSIEGHPEVFVIGDASHFKTSKGKILPGIATVALQQGSYVGQTIRDEIKKKSPSRLRKRGFKYFDKGSLATIGTGKAVGSVGKLKFAGLTAWLIWGFVHIAYLIGFRNRLSVMLEWSLHLLTGSRSSRIIHGTIDENLPRRESEEPKEHSTTHV